MSDSGSSTARELPPFRCRAFNYAAESTNRIHSDEVARRYGFAGGLVPGVGVYAAMCDRLMSPPLEAFGAEWLERGSLSIELLKPVYDGEEIEVRGGVKATEGGGGGGLGGEPAAVALEVWNPAGVLCARGEAVKAAGAVQDPGSGSGATEAALDFRPEEFERAPLPGSNERRAPEAGAFSAGEALGTLRFGEFDPASENPYFETLRKGKQLLAGPPPLAHPAWLLHQANMLFAANIALGPWIHTRSRVRHLARAPWPTDLEMRARVREAFEKKGHHFLIAEMTACDLKGHAFAAIEHQAIIKPRARLTILGHSGNLSESICLQTPIIKKPRAKGSRGACFW